MFIHLLLNFVIFFYFFLNVGTLTGLQFNIYRLLDYFIAINIDLNDSNCDLEIPFFHKISFKIDSIHN